MLTIRIPGKIDPDLSPNSHKHWRTKHRAQQAAKAEAKAAAMEIVGAGCEAYANTAFAWDATIWLARGEQRKDGVNIIAMLKHYEDGLVLGLGALDDRYWRVGTITQERDPNGIGGVEFRLTPIAASESEAA